MLDKIVAILLSTGMLLSPVSSNGMERVSRELTARVPVAVEKQQVEYEKYSTKSGIVFYDYRTEIYLGLNAKSNSDEYPITVYDDFRIDPLRGFVGVGPSKADFGEDITGKFATEINDKNSNHINTVYRVEGALEQHATPLNGWKFTYHINTKKEYIALRKDGQVPSELIEVITADEGLYPSNGLHSDGYWYKLKGLEKS